ncbi:MAG: hypothetical protein HYV39_02990 [Candidatus Levybacteria bacterium]|nr:hypothetical protein [Candidatus Levybacteria bacterium]
MSKKKSTDPTVGIGTIALVVIVLGLYSGNLKVSVPQASTQLPPTNSVATSSVLEAANGADVPNPLSERVDAKQLPPSHQGGEVIYNGGVLRGFPDAGVETSVIPESAKKVSAIFSWYWPNLGGTNCSSFRSDLPDRAFSFPDADHSSGWCWSRMSSGENWEYYVGRAVACPQEWPFGTKVYAFGREWLCLDHGGAIVTENGESWIDFLTPSPPMSYRTHFDVWVLYP